MFFYLQCLLYHVYWVQSVLQNVFRVQCVRYHVYWVQCELHHAYWKQCPCTMFTLCSEYCTNLESILYHIYRVQYIL